jgi:hypothetical protein
MHHFDLIKILIFKIFKSKKKNKNKKQEWQFGPKGWPSHPLRPWGWPKGLVRPPPDWPIRGSRTTPKPSIFFFFEVLVLRGGQTSPLGHGGGAKPSKKKNEVLVLGGGHGDGLATPVPFKKKKKQIYFFYF